MPTHRSMLGKSSGAPFHNSVRTCEKIKSIDPIGPRSDRVGGGCTTWYCVSQSLWLAHDKVVLHAAMAPAGRISATKLDTPRSISSRKLPEWLPRIPRA